MTAPEVIQWTELGLKVGGWAIEMIARFVDGDDSEEVRRVIDILPAELKSDVEHRRQRKLLEAELRADLAGRPTVPALSVDAARPSLVPPPQPFDDPVAALLRAHGYDDSSPVATLTTIIEELERLGGPGAPPGWRPPNEEG